MNGLTQAIAWSVSDVTLCLFAGFPAGVNVAAPKSSVQPEPRVVRSYYLEDLDGRLPGYLIHEFDLIYDDVPSNLEAIVRSWIEAIIAEGAFFAWFGFEGSFSLDHVLTGDIANQVFAVATQASTDLALDDDYRRGPDWAEHLREVRKQLHL